jgi:hypothetical protein
MSNKISLMCGFLLAFSFMLSSVAMAAGSSVNDSFDALSNSKGGSKSVAGMDAFDDIAKSKGNNDAGAGHGIEAGLQAIETNRAEKQARDAELKRLRMEEDAKKQDAYLAENCDCHYGEYADGRCKSAALISIIQTCYGENAYGFQEQIPCASSSMGEEERQASATAKAEKHRLCTAWKAEGPKANSAAFRAQLAQQYAVIDASKQKWKEEEKKRDEIIRADFKKTSEKAAKDQQDSDQAARDAERAKTASASAKVKAEADEREAKQKAWCMADQSRMSSCSCNRYRTTTGPACRVD